MKAPGVKFLSRFGAMVLAATMLTVAIAAVSVDTSKTQVTATFRQMNVPVDGRFKTVSGTIEFDSKQTATGRARIEIDTASFDVGAPEYNDELRKKEWFDTPTYPKATFVSASVVAAGQNRFVATGKLMLKGKTQEIKVAFTQRNAGGVQVYEGELPISRKTYAIGGADWDDVLEDQVLVKFRITTAAK